MTKREFTSIVLKLTGIYILVRYIRLLPMVLSPLNVIEWGDPSAISTWLWGLAATVPSFIYLAICILIVVKSKAIAAKLIKDDGEFNVGFRLNYDDVLTIAFCCIGLVVLVGAIPELVQWGSNLALNKMMAQKFNHSPQGYRAYTGFLAILVQVLIGGALFLQPRDLAGLWKKLRTYK